MIHLEFDRQLSKTIKIIREIRGMKQVVVAYSLGIEQSTYSRIETGEITITPGQLKIIACELKTTALEIMAIANGDIYQFQGKPLSTITPKDLTLSKTEIALIFSRLNGRMVKQK